jgi:hypothetical protein
MAAYPLGDLAMTDRSNVFVHLPAGILEFVDEYPGFNTFVTLHKTQNAWTLPLCAFATPPETAI